MLSIYDWFGYDIEIRDRYKLIKEVGFEGVMLSWSDGFGRGNGYQDSVSYAIEAGLFVENIHTPVQHQDSLSSDNQEGKDLFDTYIQCVKDCNKFDIKTMVIHLPDDKYPINNLGMDRIHRIIDRAELYKVQIALENVRNIQNVFRVLEESQSTQVGFCYDCCHHANYDSNKDLLGKYGKRLMAIHLHDNGGERGQHQLPFDGNICWSSIMKDIARIGYKGEISLEPMNWGYENITIHEFLTRAYEKGKKLEEMFCES